MKINRRDLMVGASASVFLASSRVEDSWSARGLAQVAPPLQNGWQTLKFGGGGYVTHIQISNDGWAIVRTDVGGAFVKPLTSPATPWFPVLTLDSLGIKAEIGQEEGVHAIAIAAKNSNYIAMNFADTKNAANNAFYISTNRGAIWTRLSGAPTFRRLIYGQPICQANAGIKLYNDYIKFDPANENVIYIGIPHRTGLLAGWYRTLDGGATWSAVADLPTISEWVDWGSAVTNNAAQVGGVGICFDTSSGTTTLSGVTVTSRILAAVSGFGVYESTNGGSSFASVSSDPTPTTSVTLTTSVTDSVVIAQVLCWESTFVKSVTIDGMAIHQRAQVWNNFQMIYEFYSTGALPPGNHTVTVNYYDGGISGIASPIVGQLGAFAVTGVDSSDASTIFSSGGPKTSTGPNPLTLPVSETSNFIFALGSNAKKTADTGWHPLNINFTNGFFTEYVIGTSASRITASGYGWILDAIKQKPGGTLALDGTPQYASSGASSHLAPIYVQTMQMDASGNVWVVNSSFGHTYGDVYRGLKSGSTLAGWDRITNGSHLATSFIQIRSPYGAVVDPIAGYQNKVQIIAWDLNHGATITNATGAIGSILVGSSVFGGAPTITYTDVPWIDIPNIGQLGGAAVNPVDHTYWAAQGIGVEQFPATLNYTSGKSYSVSKSIFTAGIEEMVTTWAMEQAGAPAPYVVLQDRNGYLSTMPEYPSAYSGRYHQSDGVNGDFSWGTPFLCVAVGAGIAGNCQASYYSFNYGDPSSIVAFSTNPMQAGVLGGNIAAAGGATSVQSASFTAPITQYMIGPSVNSGGSGGAEGTYTFTVLGGTGTPATVQGTVTGGVLSGALRFVSTGNYTVMPPYPATLDGSVASFSTNPKMVWSDNQGRITVSDLSGSINVGDVLDGVIQGVTSVQGSINRFNYTQGVYIAATESRNTWLLNNSKGVIQSSAARTTHTNTANLVCITGTNTSSSNVKYTIDCGYTWSTCAGLPSVAYVGANSRAVMLCADRDTPGTFYLAVPGHGVYRSTDSGAHFSSFLSLPVSGTLNFVSVPGTSTSGGPTDLLMCKYISGKEIYYSTNGGAFVALTGGAFSEVWYVTVGKQAASGTYPTITLFGTLVATRVRGVYQSYDKGANWTLIGSPYNATPSLQMPQLNSNDSPQFVVGSWQVERKVIIGYNSTGTVQWQP